MPNLQKLEIKVINGLDESKIVAFLKANPQIKKLDTNIKYYNAKIFKAILSLKFLERWYIRNWSFDVMEANDLPYNYSIKYLNISGRIPAPLALQIINSCNNLEILDLGSVHNNMYENNFLYLDWSKVKKNINILKLSSCCRAYDEIKNIDNSKLFNQIHFYYDGLNYIVKKFDEYFNGKLVNYKVIPYTSQILNPELINKID